MMIQAPSPTWTPLMKRLALLAIGALLLVWRIGERMQRGVGLLAMALLAAMPALGIHSHNMTRDTCGALAAQSFHDAVGGDSIVVGALARRTSRMDYASRLGLRIPPP